MAGGLYEGNALQGVDAKGRVAIPAQFRTVIERNAEGADARTIVVTRHPDLPCLRAYDTSWSHEHFQRIDERELAAADATVFARQKERSFGAVDRALFDPSGRFFIHPFMKKKAGIAEWAFFAGAGRTFNIWAPQVLLGCADADEDIREMCEFMLDDKAARR